MKKNDFAVFVVYVAMFALAIVAGLVWIRPMTSQFSNSVGINPIVLIILSIVAGILLNALLLELGHLTGAKIGKLRLRSFIVLGFGFKKGKAGKKIGFHSFDGLTGETKVAPKDREKSSLMGYIAFPLIYFLIEVVIMVVLMSVSSYMVGQNSDSTAGWMQIFAVCCLVVGGMIYIYDYFPAHLDSTTDGYLMVLVSKPTNKKAYNDLLLADEAAELGQPVPNPIVYDDLTDLTFNLNLNVAYADLAKGDVASASKIIDKLMTAEKVSPNLVNEAGALKLSILLSSANPREGIKMYKEDLNDNVKKYISNVSSPAALRCYLLISALVEESETEAYFALDKVEKVYKGLDKTKAKVDRALLEANVALTKKLHPTWNLPDLPWAKPSAETKEEKPAEPVKEEAKAEVKEEVKPAEEKPVETKPTGSSEAK